MAPEAPPALLRIALSHLPKVPIGPCPPCPLGESLLHPQPTAPAAAPLCTIDGLLLGSRSPGKERRGEKLRDRSQGQPCSCSWQVPTLPGYLGSEAQGGLCHPPGRPCLCGLPRGVGKSESRAAFPGLQAEACPCGQGAVGNPGTPHPGSLLGPIPPPPWSPPSVLCSVSPGPARVTLHPYDLSQGSCYHMPIRGTQRGDGKAGGGEMKLPPHLPLPPVSLWPQQTENPASRKFRTPSVHLATPLQWYPWRSCDGWGVEVPAHHVLHTGTCHGPAKSLAVGAPARPLRPQSSPRLHPAQHPPGRQASPVPHQGLVLGNPLPFAPVRAVVAAFCCPESQGTTGSSVRDQVREGTTDRP